MNFRNGLNLVEMLKRPNVPIWRNEHKSGNSLVDGVSWPLPAGTE